MEMKNLILIPLFVFAGLSWTFAQGTLIYDNGPAINSIGTGVGGVDESILPDITWGHLFEGPGWRRLASKGDDFTLNSPARILRARFYGYQRLSDTFSTITHLYVRIWDGMPGTPGSSVIYGDFVNNVILSTGWTRAYRARESTSGRTTQAPVMYVEASMDVLLPAGTYWIECTSEGDMFLPGPFIVPYNRFDIASTGNAVSSGDSTNYFPLLDGADPMGLPFQIYGKSFGNEIPTVSEWGLILLGLSFLGLGSVILYNRKKKPALI